MICKHQKIRASETEFNTAETMYYHELQNINFHRLSFWKPLDYE